MIGKEGWLGNPKFFLTTTECERRIAEAVAEERKWWRWNIATAVERLPCYCNPFSIGRADCYRCTKVAAIRARSERPGDWQNELLEMQREDRKDRKP